MSYGEDMWCGFTAVIFDEIDQMAVDPGYALLWDSARQVAEARPLLVIGASATYSSEMIAKTAPLRKASLNTQSIRLPDH